MLYALIFLVALALGYSGARIPFLSRDGDGDAPDPPGPGWLCRCGTWTEGVGACCGCGLAPPWGCTCKGTSVPAGPRGHVVRWTSRGRGEMKR